MLWIFREDLQDANRRHELFRIIDDGSSFTNYGWSTQLAHPWSRVNDIIYRQLNIKARWIPPLPLHSFHLHQLQQSSILVKTSQTPTTKPRSTLHTSKWSALAPSSPCPLFCSQLWHMPKDVQTLSPTTHTVNYHIGAIMRLTPLWVSSPSSVNKCSEC